MDAIRGYESCSGCSLCLLACPVWHATRDPRFAPEGRTKALQHGASVAELAASVESCTLCGACEPACPEQIDLTGMIMRLRAELRRSVPEHSVAGVRTPAPAASRIRDRGGMRGSAGCLLVPGESLAANSEVLDRVLRLLGAAVSTDTGADIALALEAGAPVSEARSDGFLGAVRGARRIIAGDGLLYRMLRRQLRKSRIETLGAALSALPIVRRGLGEADLYVIEPRAYHADRERLVRHYSALAAASGCSTNLDLQRLAIATTAASLPEKAGRNRVDPLAQARWIMEGRSFSRIIVEDLDDMGVFRQVTDVPVLHVSELAERTKPAACIRPGFPAARHA